jgi:hypothetical protein
MLHFTREQHSDSLLFMSGVILPPTDRPQMLMTMRRPTPSTVHQRTNALLLLDEQRVAEVLFIDAEAAREYCRLYEISGTAGLAR